MVPKGHISLHAKVQETPSLALALPLQLLRSGA
jgi:hypothetical protein